MRNILSVVLLASIQRISTVLLAVGLLCQGLLAVAPQDQQIDPDPQPRWWKGNLHTHSLWSDGNDFPEMISDWYRQRGYHFLAISDHNVLQEGSKWIGVDKVQQRSHGQGMERYLERFGRSWVETRGEPGSDNYQVRLKPLDERSEEHTSDSSHYQPSRMPSSA